MLIAHSELSMLYCECQEGQRHGAMSETQPRHDERTGARARAGAVPPAFERSVNAC